MRPDQQHGANTPKINKTPEQEQIKRDDSWWCDSCQETHHDGQTCSAQPEQEAT